MLDSVERFDRRFGAFCNAAREAAFYSSALGCNMRILALETTDKTGSVAALADANLLAELELDHTQRSAQSLAPAHRGPAETGRLAPAGRSIGGRFGGARVVHRACGSG